MATSTTPETDGAVAKPSAQAAALQTDWDLARDLMGGTRAMRVAGEKYLPRFPMEEETDWRKRRDSAVLFPAFRRTVLALAAKPFSKTPTLSEGAHADVVDWMADCDLQGRNLGAFGVEGMRHALAFGLGGILVDFPRSPAPATPAADGTPPPQVITQQQEREAGMRPYFVLVHAHQLLGWRCERTGGQWQLAMLRFVERVEEEDGAYGTRDVEQVRVIFPTRWEIWRKNNKGEWVMHDAGINTLGKVPFAPFYGERMGYMLGRSPLAELAHMNVAHWQSWSDQQNILHVARVPILALIGADDQTKIVVGTKSAVKLPMGADLKFVEPPSGKAIEAGATDLKDLEDRMRQAGAELLVLAPGKVTASQVLSEDSASTCALQQIAEDFEDTLDLALSFVAAWARHDSAATVTLFKDFGAASLAEASSKLLLDMNMAGKLSDETLFEETQRRGFIAGERSWVDEQGRLSEQGPRLPTDPAAGQDTQPGAGAA